VKEDVKPGSSHKLKIEADCFAMMVSILKHFFSFMQIQVLSSYKDFILECKRSCIVDEHESSQATRICAVTAVFEDISIPGVVDITCVFHTDAYDQ